MGVALAYPISFFDRHGWALWFIRASAHSTIVNLFWRVRAGITKLHRWWMAFWSSRGYLRENRYYLLRVYGMGHLTQGSGRRQIRNFCLYIFVFQIQAFPSWQSRMEVRLQDRRSKGRRNYKLPPDSISMSLLFTVE